MPGKQLDLVLDIPGPDEPGFLKRQRTAMMFMRKMRAAEDATKYDETMIDDMARFVCQFVTEPEDTAEAIEIVLNLSENQFIHIMDSIQDLNAEDDPK